MNNIDLLFNNIKLNTFNIIAFWAAKCLLYALEDSLSINLSNSFQEINIFLNILFI